MAAWCIAAYPAVHDRADDDPAAPSDRGLVRSVVPGPKVACPYSPHGDSYRSARSESWGARRDGGAARSAGHAAAGARGAGWHARGDRADHRLALGATQAPVRLPALAGRRWCRRLAVGERRLGQHHEPVADRAPIGLGRLLDRGVQRSWQTKRDAHVALGRPFRHASIVRHPVSVRQPEYYPIFCTRWLTKSVKCPTVQMSDT